MLTLLKRIQRRASLSLKRLLPSNLFGRSLLILVLPMVLSQLVIAHIFYDRHWSSVSRNMASATVGDIAWLYQTYTETEETDGQRAALAKTQALGHQLNVEVDFVAGEDLAKARGRGRREFPDLYKDLTQRIVRPIAIYLHSDSNRVKVRIGIEEGVLSFSVNRKLLTSSTTTIFMVWMIGSSMLLTLIATLFLRNQVKPIVTLARVAEQFGLGQDVTDFKPRGASEVRRAGRAFLVMSERIHRHIQNRTEMLAGISHDLRTPLTRMKLELELSTMGEETRKALTGDIDAMGRMIDEYLDFARGDAGELMEPIDLNLLLTDIVRDYRRSKRAVSFTPMAEPVTQMLRPQAMRRALTNLIDNGLRYGAGTVQLVLEQSVTFVRVKVTDQGKGIPESEHEMVFKPFTRLEPSRNTQTGGVGLGLSIARAIAQSHGGDVTLENQRDDDGMIMGLEVTLRLPRAVQPIQ